MIIPKSGNPGVEVYREDIPKYFNRDVELQLRIWNDYKTFGWAWLGGYAELPAVYVDLIRTIEIENGKRMNHGNK